MRARAGLGILALLACIAGCATQGGKSGAPRPCRIDGIVNCRSIGNDVTFASQPTPDALRTLAKDGYRTVVSLRGDGELKWDEKAEVDSLGMTYAAIPMNYPIDDIQDEWVQRFDELMKGAERPMLIHCSSGNRVAGLWAVWLAEREGMATDRALELGTEAGMTRVRAAVEKRLGSAAK
jgi:uncharacterized protein (TIGR01244 family)